MLASSGKAEHVDLDLDLLGAKELADAWTPEDVRQTKPEPDLVAAAVRTVNGTSACLVGDSTWECLAAGRLDVPTVGVLTGGSPVRNFVRRAPNGCSTHPARCSTRSKPHHFESGDPRLGISPSPRHPGPTRSHRAQRRLADPHRGAS